MFFDISFTKNKRNTKEMIILKKEIVIGYVLHSDVVPYSLRKRSKQKFRESKPRPNGYRTDRPKTSDAANIIIIYQII